ncbi:hypothetical protein [Antarctobacter heliothermus]|uniref:hypothetical protein n=1 Tax=Antarctobacter heliothermus TaxID=74033 RepID=UPI0012FE6454|nr:hypothetical protein [Antarctobacter heliothermus]
MDFIELTEAQINRPQIILPVIAGGSSIMRQGWRRIRQNAGPLVALFLAMVRLFRLSVSPPGRQKGDTLRPPKAYFP